MVSIEYAVSVICNVHNAGKFVAGFLDALRQQTFTDFELLLVDDGSTDSTLDVVRQYCHHLNIRLIRLPHVGLKSARAVGVETASGEVCVILDVDEMFEEYCIEQFVLPFRDPTIGGVGGTLISSGDNWIIRGSNIVRQVKHRARKDENGNPWMIPGGCMAVRKSAVESVGGFVKFGNVAGDYDISRRLRQDGWRLVSIDELRVFHQDPDTLRGVFQRQFKTGTRVFPSLGRGNEMMSTLKMFVPVIYVLAIIITVVSLVLNPWIGALFFWVIVGGILLSFNETGSTLKEKLFALIVLTTDSLGYSLGVLHGLVVKAKS